MNKEQVKKKILEYKWEEWLGRPYGAFWMSLFKGSNTREAMQKVGVDAENRVIVYDQGFWYENEEFNEAFAREMEEYLKNGGSVKKISESSEKFLIESKEEIMKIIESSKSALEKLKEIQEILVMSTTYIWFAHGLETIYTKKLKEEVPKYFEGDVDKYIGDISFPIKKNAHVKMEEAIRRGDDLEEVAEKYGWLKVRDGFSDPFTASELKKDLEKLTSGASAKHKKVTVPKELEELVSETQELVYHRTARTDVFYELFFMCRPILKEVAKHYNLNFKDLKDYSIDDLAKGNSVKYSKNLSALAFGEDFYFYEEKIIKDKKIDDEEIKGSIAFKGVAKGIVKIMKNAGEIEKVGEGDILVTRMTFPSYILAMKRAAAFVTDEGGITCHAAIVAREMKKPCIIGTKTATKILKDGDLVEVDANEGVVKVIKKNNE